MSACPLEKWNLNFHFREYKEVIYNIEKIVESVIKFVDDYVEHIKGIKKLHEREFERRYHFSS